MITFNLEGKADQDCKPKNNYALRENYRLKIRKTQIDSFKS